MKCLGFKIFAYFHPFHAAPPPTRPQEWSWPGVTCRARSACRNWSRTATPTPPKISAWSRCAWTWTIKWTRVCTAPMMGQCRASVCDAGSAMSQRWINVSRLLGRAHCCCCAQRHRLLCTCSQWRVPRHPFCVMLCTTSHLTSFCCFRHPSLHTLPFCFIRAVDLIYVRLLLFSQNAFYWTNITISTLP